MDEENWDYVYAQDVLGVSPNLFAEIADNNFKRIGSDEVNGTIVSTVRLMFCSDDYIYETCLFPENGHSDVVERYKTRDEAIKGHAKWFQHLKITTN